MVGAPELKARALFLTGATGLIGGALLHRFVSQTRAKVYCLVRQMGAEQAPLERLHSRLNGSIAPEQLHDRVVLVPGVCSCRAPPHNGASWTASDMAQYHLSRSTHD
jgi:NAD dependent epimerase/dehydratase family enzyme